MKYKLHGNPRYWSISSDGTQVVHKQLPVSIELKSDPNDPNPLFRVVEDGCEHTLYAIAVKEIWELEWK